MKRSNTWFALILIASALLLNAARSANAELKNHRTQQHQAKAEPQAKPVEQKEPQVPSAIWQATISALRESIADNKQQAIAAQKQAEASKETFFSPAVVVNEVLALVGLCYLYLMYLQWAAIDEQARIAKDTLIQTSRPWVSYQILLNGDLTYDTNGARLELKFILKNTGHSVAQNAWIVARLIPCVPKIRGGPTDLRAEQEELVAMMSQRNQPKAKLGYPLFPDADNIEFPMAVVSSYKEMEAAALMENSKRVVFAVVGCVDYWFTFGAPTDHHQTGFIYHLAQYNPDTGATGAIFEVGTTVFAKYIRLIANPLEGHFAS